MVSWETVRANIVQTVVSLDHSAEIDSADKDSLKVLVRTLFKYIFSYHWATK